MIDVNLGDSFDFNVYKIKEHMLCIKTNDAGYYLGYATFLTGKVQYISDNTFKTLGWDVNSLVKTIMLSLDNGDIKSWCTGMETNSLMDGRGFKNFAIFQDGICVKICKNGNIKQDFSQTNGLFYEEVCWAKMIGKKS